ncbi:TorF family putative porin [Mesorhizobium sp. LHD-90]|uniref:TorF family putative porin n=1 Tax=Mesorhizobium sp. LHD-90 TaxID=3071414 RepID=UPI0027E20F3B|nr:TorF family putative porin [Mesorhizobium sp. LHD-90]MDQ6436576.1 TorF family putative porin [Mesorhizobium sp. LHD-90]
MIGLICSKVSAYKWPILRQAAVVSIAIFLTGRADAIEQDIGPDSPPQPQEIVATPLVPFNVGFGIALSTEYASRGITNSDRKPAIQGYIEPSVELPVVGTTYVNIWASNVDYGEGFEGAEIDVAAGIRPELGPLSFDLGYVHYFYTPEHVSPDYGEIFAKVDYNVNDMFTVGGRVFFAPDFNQSGTTGTWVAAGVRVPLPHDFAVYGGIGYQFLEDPDAFEQLAWTAGISYTWKTLTFDVRYIDTDLSEEGCIVRSGFADGCESRVRATVSFDTSWSAVKDWMSER